MICIRTQSAEETVEAGERLGGILKPGDIVCLSGELGAGKTAFTGGIARALGITGYVTSPTFTIVNEYDNGRIPLYHFDVYRIGNPEELFELGFEEYLYAGGIVVIEWASLVEEALPDAYIRVEITREPEDGANRRKICIRFEGGRYNEYEHQLV